MGCHKPWSYGRAISGRGALGRGFRLTSHNVAGKLQDCLSQTSFSRLGSLLATPFKERIGFERSGDFTLRDHIILYWRIGSVCLDNAGRCWHHRLWRRFSSPAAPRRLSDQSIEIHQSTPMESSVIMFTCSGYLKWRTPQANPSCMQSCRWGTESALAPKGRCFWT